MRHFEKEKKLPSYTVAALYILIGCAICFSLFLYGSSLSKNSTSTTPALFQLSNIETPSETSDLLSTETEANLTTPATEESTELPAQPETPIYTFKTLNTKSSLHVRIAPGMTSEIIDRLAPGTTGDVLEKGDDWSLIKTGDIKGYVSNRYLEFQEIPADEDLSQ